MEECYGLLWFFRGFLPLGPWLWGPGEGEHHSTSRQRWAPSRSDLAPCAQHAMAPELTQTRARDSPTLGHAERWSAIEASLTRDHKRRYTPATLLSELAILLRHHSPRFPTAKQTMNAITPLFTCITVCFVLGKRTEPFRSPDTQSRLTLLMIVLRFRRLLQRFAPVHGASLTLEI